MKTPIEQLLEIESFEERIKLVAQDVENRTDVFKKIPSHELFELLGNDYASTLTPWYCVPDLCDLLECNEDLEITEELHRLEGEVTAKRYNQLLLRKQELKARTGPREPDDRIEDITYLGLRPKEEEIIARSICEELPGEEYDYDPLGVYTLNFGEGVVFKANCDRGGWDDMYGPYETRDGQGFNLDRFIEGDPEYS